MMDREDQVLWLGMGLVFANFFFSGQFKSLWSVFVSKPPSNSILPPLIPLPFVPGLPPVLPIGSNTTPKTKPGTGTV